MYARDSWRNVIKTVVVCLLFSLVHSFFFLLFAHDARSSFCIRFHISNLSFYLCNFVSVLLLLLLFLFLFLFHLFASLRAYPVANNVRFHTHTHASLTIHEMALKLLDWDLFTYKRKSILAVTHDVLQWVDVCVCVCVFSVSSPFAFFVYFVVFTSLHSFFFLSHFLSSSRFFSLLIPNQQNCNNKNTTRMQNASEAKAERNVNVNRGS